MNETVVNFRKVLRLWSLLQKWQLTKASNPHWKSSSFTENNVFKSRRAFWLACSESYSAKSRSKGVSLSLRMNEDCSKIFNSFDIFFCKVMSELELRKVKSKLNSVIRKTLINWIIIYTWLVYSCKIYPIFITK